MRIDITALFVVLDDFAKLYEEARKKQCIRECAIRVSGFVRDAADRGVIPRKPVQGFQAIL